MAARIRAHGDPDDEEEYRGHDTPDKRGVLQRGLVDRHRRILLAEGVADGDSHRQGKRFG